MSKRKEVEHPGKPSAKKQSQGSNANKQPPSKKILLDRISKELGTLKHAVGEVVDAIGFIDSPDFSELEKTLERGFASICPGREDKLMSRNASVMGFESVSTSISSIIQYLEATRKSQEEGFESVSTELKEMRKSHKTLMRELIEVLRDGLPGPTLHA
jgi:hypothetical protein